MKHFNFTATFKVLVIAVVLIAPKLVSAQIGPIGTIGGNTANVSVFPLPFSTEINIQGLQSPTPDVQVFLYTMLGVVALQDRIPAQNLLNVRTSTVAPGTYQMIIYDDNMNQLFTKKVVKTQASTRH